VLDATPAAAVPILYTFTGTLTLGSTMDSLDLDGATLTITVQVDSNTLPNSTTAGTNEVLAFYEGIVATGVFSGRPNSVADEIVSYTTRLLVQNRFPPSTAGDIFGISTANATFSSQTIGMPAMTATFADQAFVPGTGAPPALPVFDASDVASFDASPIVNPIRYDVGDVNITSVVVPEPSTALLFGGGMLMLATVRRVGARL